MKNEIRIPIKIDHEEKHKDLYEKFEDIYLEMYKDSYGIYYKIMHGRFILADVPGLSYAIQILTDYLAKICKKIEDASDEMGWVVIKEVEK